MIKKFTNLLRNIFSKPIQSQPDWPPFDISAQIARIKTIESEKKIDLGQRINCFSYKHFELNLDCDITGFYRIVVYEGRDRRFSFSIRCKQGDYEAFLSSLKEIVEFLDGDRRIKNLPKHDLLKGYYFGS